MTPRDELRRLLTDAASHLRRLPETTELGDVQMAERLEAAAASLPAGGGDGEAVKLLWRVGMSGDGWSSGLDPDLRDEIDDWWERTACPTCKGRGARNAGAERIVCSACGGTRRRAPVSSSAGDEAREARAVLNAMCGEWGDVPSLLRAVSNGTAAEAAHRNSNTAQRATDALRRVADEWDRRASRASPLPGAGDGLDAPIARAVLMEVGYSWRGDWSDFDGRALRDLLDEFDLLIGKELAGEDVRGAALAFCERWELEPPAPLPGVEQTKETTR